MKIRDVIVEAMNPPGISMPAMADMILRKCQPYIKQVGLENTLMRGLHPAVSEFTINDCPVNRKPVDTPIYLHNIVDNWMLAKFGIRYRSNAVFATGSGSQASAYGHRYAVYPIGNFTFCWSPTVYDLTKQFKPAWTQATADEDGGEGRMVEALDNAEYQTTDLARAIKSRHEVMIHCKEYIMVDLEWNEVLVSYIQDEDTRDRY
jgi:hypothetical protein